MPILRWLGRSCVTSLSLMRMAPDVTALLRVMEECNLTALVNLDGRWGRELEANLDRYDRAHPHRFLTFEQVQQ